jgi:hypothetical protein
MGIAAEAIGASVLGRWTMTPAEGERAKSALRAYLERQRISSRDLAVRINTDGKKVGPKTLHRFLDGHLLIDDSVMEVTARSWTGPVEPRVRAPGPCLVWTRLRDRDPATRHGNNGRPPSRAVVPGAPLGAQGSVSPGPDLATTLRPAVLPGQCLDEASRVRHPPELVLGPVRGCPQRLAVTQAPVC